MSKLHIGCFSLLVCFFIAACSKDTGHQTSILKFRFSDGSSCQDRIVINGQTWRLHHLAFFLSDFYWVRGEQVFELKLKTNAWQDKQVALIKMAGACENVDSVNAELHFEGVQDWQAGDILRFGMFVPFTLNHANPLQQTSPLNHADMFWSWQMGYKFMRLDIQQETDAWSYHFGSVGCNSPSVVRAPQQSCAYPNHLRFDIEITNTNNQVTLHFDRWLAKYDLRQTEACMFNHHQLAQCLDMLNTLEDAGLFVW